MQTLRLDFQKQLKLISRECSTKSALSHIVDELKVRSLLHRSAVRAMSKRLFKMGSAPKTATKDCVSCNVMVLGAENVGKTGKKATLLLQLLALLELQGARELLYGNARRELRSKATLSGRRSSKLLVLLCSIEL